MKILFITDNGNWPLMYRLQKEGMNIKVYVHDKDYYPCYKNIMPRVSLSNLKKEVKNSEVIIFTMTRPNRNTKEDRALLKIFKLPLKSRTVFGPVAEKIRKQYPHKKIIGSSVFTEEMMEMDRNEAGKIAKKIELNIPETHEFKSLKEGLSFLKGRKDLWVIKPHGNLDLDLTFLESFPGELINKMTYEYQQRLGNNCEFILQKVIKGTEISNERWFDGKEWVHSNFTIENKTFMNNELGPRIGSALNTVFVSNTNFLKDNFEKLTPMLIKAGYIGPIDINVIVDKNGNPFFCEFSPRMTTDAHYCLYTLLEGKISDFLLNGFRGKFKKGFSAGVRVSIPPYPYGDKKLLKELAKGVSIDNNITDMWFEDVSFFQGLKCAGIDSIIGVMTSYGKDCQVAWSKVYNELKKLKISTYTQWRSDGHNQAQKRLKKLEGVLK